MAEPTDSHGISPDQFKRLERFFSFWIDPVYVADREFQIIWSNNAFRQAFGVRRRHKKPCHETIKLGLCGSEQCLLRQVEAKKDVTQTIETPMGAALANEAMCAAKGFPIVEPDTGEVIAVVGILRDTSVEVQLHTKYQGMLKKEQDQKALLEEMVKERTLELEESNEELEETVSNLQKSRRETREILQNIRQAIFTIGPDLQIGGTQSAYARTVFGRRDLEGLPLVELLFGNESTSGARDLEEWLKLVFNSASLEWSAAERLVQREYEYRGPNCERDLLVDFEPIRDEGQAPSRLMVIAQDLTEKRRLEESLQKKEDEANENIEQLAELAQVDPDVYEAFFEEAEEILSSAETALETMSSDPNVGDAVEKMYRGMHTLKGNAMFVGLFRVAAKAHWVEDAFSELRHVEGTPDAAVLDDAKNRVQEVRTFFERIQKMAVKVLSQEEEKDLGHVRSQDREVRVQVTQSKLDALCQWVDGLPESVIDGSARSRLLERINGLSLVNMEKLYGRFPKLVRDLAEKLEKNVQEIRLEGGDTDIDAKVLNTLAGALVHIVRNAVDHGLEGPIERLEKKKPKDGLIAVSAEYTDAHLEVCVRDDGRGLDPEALTTKAKEKGLIPPDAVLSEQDAFALLCAPGFSTAAAVTDVSGRGVGMDAVKVIVEEELGGTLEIQSELGQGTRFTLRIPRDLALSVNQE